MLDVQIGRGGHRAVQVQHTAGWFGQVIEFLRDTHGLPGELITELLGKSAASD